MLNYYFIYLSSVVILICLSVIYYEAILVNLGLQMNLDKSFFKDLEDTPENRIKIANFLILISVILAPITLFFLIASFITDQKH